ncbi:MAG: multiple sugar transport system ATP-binding protein [Clostridiales bacterium]|nr:multiple sugar transport system ATP-binding protein [Clostridiales bacterium]
MASLKLKNVCKKYTGGMTAVSDFNLDVDDKEFLVLVGPSGCGKSTTLRMIAGLEEITQGELYIDDKLVNEIEARDRDVAIVFQNYALYPEMTVFDNMAFGLKMQKIYKDEIEKRVYEAAKILDMNDFLYKKPNILSSDKQQKVAIGRAIVRQPKIFLMDELLSNLDAHLRVQMRTEIGRIHRMLQKTFIYGTHDQAEAMAMGTRVVVMRDGIIQQIDTPQGLYEKPRNMFVAGFIGSPQMNFITAKVKKKGNEIYLIFGENAIKLPPAKAKRLEDGYVDKEVVLGIRPENLHNEEAFLALMPESVLEAKIDIAEMLGADTFLYMRINDMNFTARVNSRTRVMAGDTIKIALDVNKIHLFDIETENAILH